jgi:hypothetical protein
MNIIEHFKEMAAIELHEFMLNGTMLAFIQQRPVYCDRGRWHAVIEAPHWRSENDPEPRYYFDLDRAKAEMECYLKAKKINIEGAGWERR